VRICLISKGLPRIPPKSGIPATIYVHTLAQQFCRLGHSVDIICSPTPNKEKQIYNTIEVGKPRLSSSNHYLQNLYELWFSLCCGLALRKLCQQNQYDVINFFEAPATAFSALLFARKGMPPFLFSSGRPVSAVGLTWESQDSPFIIRVTSNAMHSYVFKRMTRITTSSSQLKDVVVKRTRIDPARVTVTPFISAETDLFRPDIDSSELGQELGLHRDDLVVLCLAPVAPYKNQLSLVKAIPHIIQKHPRAKFLFVGEISKEYHSQISDFIKSHNLGRYVIFTGFIRNYADLPKYYNLADVYVLVSRGEGNLPKTILEAMSCGKAVVASSIPQNREGAKRGDEVIFVDPYDVDAISNAINKLLDNPELRQRVGENARQTVIEYYAPEVVARRLIRVYEEVIAGKIEDVSVR
jgi:glycosyltransferase involved in cell wall biosynthesis